MMIPPSDERSPVDFPANIGKPDALSSQDRELRQQATDFLEGTYLPLTSPTPENNADALIETTQALFEGLGESHDANATNTLLEGMTIAQRGNKPSYFVQQQTRLL